MTLNKADFESRYNNSSTGKFKAGQSRGIDSEKQRDLVTQLKDSFLSNVDDIQLLTSATGANDYAVVSGITSYVTNQVIFIKTPNASTGPATLNRNSLGAKKLFKTPTTQVTTDDLVANGVYICVYDATLDSASGGYHVIGLGGGGSGSVSDWGDIGGTVTDQTDLTAYIAAQVADLVASAPGALDTLNELAAALGDDANFATTVTNALALKAPLASPALTGTPTAPTASTGTNTTQVATTAFAKAEIAATAWLLTGSFAITTPEITGVPTFIGGVNIKTNAIGVTQTIGLSLINETSAGAGAQQMSPSFRIGGQGWKTNATTASQPVEWVMDVLPIQGAANPTSQLRFTNNVNGVASTGSFTLDSNGGTMRLYPNGLQVRAGSGLSGGISLTGSTPTSNTITITAGGFSITSGGNWSAAGTGITISPGNTINATSGTQIAVGLTGQFSPSSGTANFIGWSFAEQINQTGGANGAVTIVSASPTLLSANAVTGFDYNPTVTTVAGLHTAWRHTIGNIVWESKISPAQITSNQNDYNPTGFNGALRLRMTSDASRDITSIAGGVDGRLLIVTNVGSNNIVIKKDDGATGTAANRFALSADTTLTPDEGRIFIYDGTSSRWRLLR